MKNLWHKTSPKFEKILSTYSPKNWKKWSFWKLPATQKKFASGPGENTFYSSTCYLAKKILIHNASPFCHSMWLTLFEHSLIRPLLGSFSRKSFYLVKVKVPYLCYMLCFKGTHLSKGRNDLKCKKCKSFSVSVFVYVLSHGVIFFVSTDLRGFPELTLSTK